MGVVGGGGGSLKRGDGVVDRGMRFSGCLLITPNIRQPENSANQAT
ncbi:hypothetical protein GCWU000324_00352 [Kingella oralis ATCC 51147]|uniref:Uncharacterized protein n=1 Tax=Kingella oralis ATCC 51147 TaxID=629741 RepID=C4GHL8_9NEIS|nr:hypothetical protein GCWU000324_00352 [Kingella oralis ATCC 51147]